MPANVNGSTINAIGFTNGPTGAFSVEGTLTIGNSFGSTIANQGTWTLGTAATSDQRGQHILHAGRSPHRQQRRPATAPPPTTTPSPSAAASSSTAAPSAAPRRISTGAASGATPSVFGSGPVPRPELRGWRARGPDRPRLGRQHLVGRRPGRLHLDRAGRGDAQPNATLTNNGAIILDLRQLRRQHHAARPSPTPAPSTCRPTSTARPSTPSRSPTRPPARSTSRARSPSATHSAARSPTTARSASPPVASSTSAAPRPSPICPTGSWPSGSTACRRSTSNYGRITNGTLTLGGTRRPGVRQRVHPAVEHGVLRLHRNPQRHLRHGAAQRHSRLLPRGRGRPHGRRTGHVHRDDRHQLGPERVGLRPGRAVHRHRDAVVGLQPDSGSVGFYADGVYLGSAPVITSAGVTTASLNVSNLRVGSESITATYSGDVVLRRQHVPRRSPSS